MDAHCNNLEHIKYIKRKIKKAQKLAWIAGNNNTSTWRRLYIYLQYIAPHLRYAANQIFTAEGDYGNMLRSGAFI